MSADKKGVFELITLTFVLCVSRLAVKLTRTTFPLILFLYVCIHLDLELFDIPVVAHKV